jgi:hypothetical protein
MMRLILSTLAILVGLAAAPGAEQFRWEAGRGGDWDLHEHLADHIERVVERLADSAERLADRVGHRLERAADRMAAHLERDADRIRTRIEARVARVEARTVRRGAGGGGWIEQGAIDDDPCRDNDRWDNDDYRHCEVREERLPAGPLAVDAGRNGGIRVEGWDGADILIRAVVQANARDEADAKRLASGVEVRTGGGRVSASGPERGGSREWWSVSYRISVPRRTDLDLSANNGGITIANVAGTIRFDTTNGGVRLSDIGGAVNGRTRNGGVRIALGGTQWDGAGLDVETSNGGVTLAIPEPYNAQLETRTANGGFRFDYPLTLTGELSPRRGISTTIGAGGAPVRVRTTNGGLRIERRGASAR